jgi:hypothetical protein
MNVEIGTEAAQFPEKEYINEIFLAGTWLETYCNFTKNCATTLGQCEGQTYFSLKSLLCFYS